MKWDIFTRFSAWNAEARGGVGRRWSTCLSTKKHLVKANHTFVTIGAGIQYFNEFRDWLRVHHPRYPDILELGPGNLARFKKLRERGD